MRRMKNKAYELFLKHFQVFCEGFVCPLIVDQDFENWSCCVVLYFCLQSKTRKGTRGFKVQELTFLLLQSLEFRDLMMKDNIVLG